MLLAHVTIRWSDENKRRVRAGEGLGVVAVECVLRLGLVTVGLAFYMLHLEIIVVAASRCLGCFKGMRPLREYHVSFDYVLSC